MILIVTYTIISTESGLFVVLQITNMYTTVQRLGQ